MKAILENPKHIFWFILALLLWGLAIPLRLTYFSGYGLGDDPNFSSTPLNFIDSGSLNFDDHHTNRLGMFIGQIASYLLFPINDYSFVLPIFLASLGVHGISLFMVKTLFYNRMAFWVSLFMLVTPFETLASTSFAPDYIVSFFSILAVWGLVQGIRSKNKMVLILSGSSLGFAILTKLSAILIFPSLGIAGLLAIRWIKHWKLCWVWFLIGFVSIISIISLVYLNIHGDPFHWFRHRAIPPEGHDVTNMLFHTLTVYPKYLYYLDNYQNWMFGLTGWLGLMGVICAVFWLKAKKHSTGVIVVLLGFLYLLILNFLPHKIDFNAYYSHPRIFRYLPLVTPYIYMAAGLLFEFLLKSRYVHVKFIAVGVSIYVVAFSLYQTPKVSEPSWSSNSDGRLLSSFFRTNPLPKGSMIYADFWNCSRLHGMNYPESWKWTMNCETPNTRQEKNQYLNSIKDGYVITGGGSLAWYSSFSWVLNISNTDFQPNKHWRLLHEIPGESKPWRKESMKIWRVTDPFMSQPLFKSNEVVSEEWETCLRTQVFPLRPEDGVTENSVLSMRQANLVTHIECLGLNISDVTGLNRFDNLRVLNLGDNKLNTLDITGVSSLRMLLLANNNISQINGLQTAKRLHTLWAANNLINHISISNLYELRDLRLDNNKLEHIDGIENLSNLEELYLIKNPHLDCVALKIPEKWIVKGRCQ